MAEVAPLVGAGQPSAVVGHPPTAIGDGYVVAIGASAGGLDALERFFDSCPSDSGAAFVVIQHLSPDHKSIMNNLLSRHTSMPVVVVEDDMRIEPGHVYLIPPGAVMHASQGHLHLTPKSPHGLTLPIDIFFASLAETYRSKAIGVVLSGTGTDGTRGTVTINAADGFVCVQEPESAKFDGMPRSAISTGVVDAVLPAEDLPGRIMAHMRHEPFTAPSEISNVPVSMAHLSADEALEAILALLFEVGGIDFRDYKPATILRRIDRRMQVRHVPDLDAYYRLLLNDRSEALTLRQEMLIAVTSFFRDAEAFDLLAEVVIPDIMANKKGGEVIRAWVAGTATGEEAYSLGILFMEAFQRAGTWPPLKIFATDVDQRCVESAGAGQYPESTSVEINRDRLEHFFIKQGNSFVVTNELRQSVVVARHNLLSDPPFTNMDLVLCRNTLIYFKLSAQERALRSLEYAIRPGGYLFLGSSESLSSGTEGLRVVSSRHKIFQKVGKTRPLSVERMMPGPMPAGRSSVVRSVSRPQPPTHVDPDLLEAGTLALLREFAPPAILVNANHEVVHVFGDVSPFVRLSAGSASLMVNRLLPGPLVPVASALLHKSNRDNVAIISDHVQVSALDGSTQHLRLSAHPLRQPEEERFTLLCFENAGDVSTDGEAGSVDVDEETVRRISILERELMATRESLQSTIEALETANEELQATNEELMASNEEMQSSNEELQSLNEELNTVNVEYQEKVLVLNRMNADLDSMAKAAGVATVFVDENLVLTRFSPDAALIFRLRDSDIGRRLDDFAHSMDYPDLIVDMESTMTQERMTEREVRSLDGRHTYLVRILPYQVGSPTVRGAVATFVDFTAFHDLRRLQAVIDALPEHVAVVDVDGTIRMVNAAWVRFARANGDPAMIHSGPGANYFDACMGGLPDEDSANEAVVGLRHVLEGTEATFSMEYPCHSPTEQRWFVMNVSRIMDGSFGAVVSHVNVTPWRQAATHHE